MEETVESTDAAVEAPAELLTEETPAEAIAAEAGTPPSAPAPYIPDFNSPEVLALKAQLDARRAEQAAEAMTLEEALGVLPLRIRGQQFYIQEPTVRQEFLLRKHLASLDETVKGEDAETAELALVEAVRPFVCRYVPEKRDIEAISAEEAPDVLGRRAIRDILRAVFGAAGASDPNA